MKTPFLDQIMREIESPWGLPPVPARAVCCKFAFAALTKRIPPSGLPAYTYQGFKITVDDAVPLGVIRFVTASGAIVKEFILDPDTLA